MREIVRVFPKLDPSLESEDAQARLRLKSKEERIAVVNRNGSSASVDYSSLSLPNETPFGTPKMDDTAAILNDIVSAANEQSQEDNDSDNEVKRERKGTLPLRDDNASQFTPNQEGMPCLM
jgi:hypothetical protein